MVSTPLKNMSQNGNLLQIGVKITNIWNHHPEIQWIQVIKLGRFGISARQPTSFHLPFLEGRGLRWEISTFPRRGHGRRMEKSRAPNWVLWRTASNILKHPKTCQTLFHKSAFALQVLPSFSISWSCWSPAKLCLQLGICARSLQESHTATPSRMIEFCLAVLTMAEAALTTMRTFATQMPFTLASPTALIT